MNKNHIFFLLLFFAVLAYFVVQGGMVMPPPDEPMDQRIYTEPELQAAFSSNAEERAAKAKAFKEMYERKPEPAPQNETLDDLQARGECLKYDTLTNPDGSITYECRD